MPRYIMDITTSKLYRGQPAVGIVRTEREVAAAFIRNCADIIFVSYDSSKKLFHSIIISEAKDIIGFFNKEPLQKLRPDKIPDSNKDGQFCFVDGDIIISAGLLWDNDFLQVIYNIKKSVNIKLAQIIYDLIPTIMPEFCVPGMFIRFPKFILDTLWTADRIYGISNHTNKDIERYSSDIGAPKPELRRIALGCNFTNDLEARRPNNTDKLKEGRFVLFVSTIEPRKNHLMMYHIWRRMAREHPEKLLPLVFVGHQGWNSADFIKILNEDATLKPDNIIIITNVNDSGLAWLYDNARFTVYPSLYEGWGLPVVESLARGQVCIASDTSSIPEAAQDCAILIDPLDFIEWYNTILRFISSDADLVALRDRIKREFHAHNWADSVDSFCSEILNWDTNTSGLT